MGDTPQRVEGRLAQIVPAASQWNAWFLTQDGSQFVPVAAWGLFLFPNGQTHVAPLVSSGMDMVNAEQLVGYVGFVGPGQNQQAALESERAKRVREQLAVAVPPPHSGARITASATPTVV